MAGDDLHPGLEGITIAETRLSHIDGDAGELVIGGFPVDELGTNATYEECLFLLLNDRLPTAAELGSFRDSLARHREIGTAVRGVIQRAAEERIDPMDALRMGVAAASLDGVIETDRSTLERVVAVCPTIVATYWRFRQGLDPIPPRDDLSHAANYLFMVRGSEPTDAEIRGLETYLNTVIDHGLNASTFAARVVISTESDIVSAVTAAVGALKGPLHGGAPGPVLETLEAVHESGDPAESIRGKLEAGQRLMGFGHRVYRVRDPRAEVLSAAAEQFYDESGDATFFRTVKEYEDAAVELLAAYKPDRRIETNVEFYTAVLLAGVGIPRELFTTTFAVSRVGGWVAHCLEQRADNRLIRPRARYVGATGRTWTPLEDR